MSVIYVNGRWVESATGFWSPTRTAKDPSIPFLPLEIEQFSLAQTLGALTLSSSAALAIAAATTQTLGAVTLSAELKKLYDAASSSGYKTATSTYSWNHTCAGDNRLLLVGVSMLSVGGSSVTGITFNGVPLTLVRARASAAGAIRAEMWKLVAPPSGTFTVEVTLSAALDSAAHATSFCNAHQSSPLEGDADASATNVGAADATVDVTTVANLDLVVDVVASSDTAITVGTGQAQRGNTTGALGSGAMSTEGEKTPPGTVTMSWTDVAGLATWSIVSAAVKPATAAAGGITADLAQTLGAVTLSAAATLALAAALSKTLGAVTLSSAATLALSTALTQTLGSAVLSATAQLAIGGVLDPVDTEPADLEGELGALTLSGATTLRIAAALTQTLGALTLSSDANTGAAITADLAVTLGALTLSAAADGLYTAPTTQAGGGPLKRKTPPHQFRMPRSYSYPSTDEGLRERAVALVATLGPLTCVAAASIHMSRAARRRAAVEILLAS